MKTIAVKTCQDCPLHSSDYMGGDYEERCHLMPGGYGMDHEVDKSVAPDCPLVDGDVTVRLALWEVRVFRYL